MKFYINSAPFSTRGVISEKRNYAAAAKLVDPFSPGVKEESKEARDEYRTITNHFYT